MKPIASLCFFIIFTFASIAMSPNQAHCHGTNYRLHEPEPAIVVEFIYSDNQPIPYAEVLVFSPDDDEIEYQNGRTDRNGRFAFYPDAPGEWRIQADDGTGHLERVSLDIQGEKDGTDRWGNVSGYSRTNGHDHHHDGLPRAWGILLGISLITNLFLGFYLFKTSGR